MGVRIVKVCLLRERSEILLESGAANALAELSYTCLLNPHLGIVAFQFKNHESPFISAGPSLPSFQRWSP